MLYRVGRNWTVWMLALFLGLGGLVAVAQQAEGQRGQRGQRGMGGDRAEWQARMAERMKERLDCTSEEWTAIEPLVNNVVEKRREAQAGVMGGFLGGRGPGGGGPGGGGPGGGPGGVQNPEAEALRTALDNKDTSPAEIKAKLDAYRAAQKKRQAELEKAREDLKKVLSVRQEAVMVSMGILE